MHIPSIRLVLSWLLAAGLAPVVFAQAEPVRVHIIGASVSGGFRDGPLWGADEQGDSVTLHRVLDRWAGGEARVTAHNVVQMTAFFTDPLGIGKQQLARCKRSAPDIVVAIDFPFWFAYGAVSGVADDESAARSRMLDAGLELIAEIEAPLLIGDLPNMAGAARRMLQPSWIPPPAVLERLNEQLREWARERPNVRLLGLAELVHRMRDVGVPLPLADGPLPTPKGALQQADRLHANRLGMALLGYELQGPLAQMFAADHPLRQQRWTFEEFVDAAGADAELELLVERAAAAKDK